MNKKPSLFLIWLCFTAIFVAIFGIVTYQVENHNIYSSLLSILFFSSIFSAVATSILNYWLKFCPKTESETDDDTTEKWFTGTITHVDGLPYKCRIFVKNALHYPSIEILQELTVVDFGSLRVTFSVNGREITVFAVDKNLTFHVTNGKGTSFSA